MRGLTSKQKKLIRQHVAKNGINNYGDLFMELEKINDYETLYQDVQRFAEDYYTLNGGGVLRVLYH